MRSLVGGVFHTSLSQKSDSAVQTQVHVHASTYITEKQETYNTAAQQLDSLIQTWCFWTCLCMKKQTTFLQDHSDLKLPLSGAAQPHISSEQLETTKGSKCQRNNHGAEKPLALQKPWKEQCIKQKKTSPSCILLLQASSQPVITSDSVLTSNSYLSFS